MERKQLVYNYIVNVCEQQGCVTRENILTFLGLKKNDTTLRNLRAIRSRLDKDFDNNKIKHKILWDGNGYYLAGTEEAERKAMYEAIKKLREARKAKIAGRANNQGRIKYYG